MAIVCVALALYLVQRDVLLTAIDLSPSQVANVSQGVVVVGESGDETRDRIDALTEAASETGELRKLVIDDIKIGTGRAVQTGDTVLVHYIGTLQNGQEFDNSRKRGEPFSFTLGKKEVIAGWEQGLIGMQIGGERVLVIPPELAYGKDGIGPIPGDATLVFAIELIAVE